MNTFKYYHKIDIIKEANNKIFNSLLKGKKIISILSIMIIKKTSYLLLIYLSKR